jgi:hypothetical protein
MKHLLLLLISILLLSSPLFGQSSKPLGVVLPPTVMGNVSNSRKQILLNTLDEEVSKYFDVSPPPQIESGELPVVSDVFQLQIIEEDGDTQLTLRWMSGNERKVETKLCGGCKTIELNGKLKELVGKLFGKEVIERPIIVGENGKGVLYSRIKDYWGWYVSGDEKKDSKYVGEIKNGKPNGQGTLTDSTRGYKYEGEWRDGQKTGHGIETQREYYSYEGRFKNGEHHGQGTFISFRNGKSKYIGEFRNNLPWNLNNYKDGKLIFIFVNGEQIKQ